jgi:SAM-dependent methyltransferase
VLTLKETSTIMQAEVIQRQYDEVIATHYDIDPQSITGDSLDRAIRQLRWHDPAEQRRTPLRVLDLGVGTGRFLEKLRGVVPGGIQPFGLDVSQKMIDIARRRLPDMVSALDDAANFDAHFGNHSFDLVSTHFVTGFVPMRLLAPKIWARLENGGYWSFIGGTKAGFPALQKMAQGKLLKRVFKGRSFDVGDFVCNPADQDEVVGCLEAQGFVVRECETFEPVLNFKNFNEFYEFAYLGGWLTPIIEALGLHRPRPVLRAMLNAWLFPVRDHHSIVIALAQKPEA